MMKFQLVAFLIPKKRPFLILENSTSWHSLFSQKFQLVIPYSGFLIRNIACKDTGRDVSRNIGIAIVS